MSNVFVSGGAGVIGQQLVPLLLENQYRVIVGDLKPKPSNFPKEVVYLKGDLNELSQETFDSLEVEIFINLAAAFERSFESYNFYENNFTNNIRLSNHLMSLARSSNSLKRVLFSSSYLVYDKTQYMFRSHKSEPIILGAGSLISPRNLVGAAKLFHESELRFISSFPETRFSVVIPRIYRGYGPGSRDVISRWIRDAIANVEIEVFDLEGVFDYIYSKDSAKGLYLLACKSDFDGIVDLGSGKSRSVMEILDYLRDIFPNIKVRSGVPAGELESSQANLEILQKVTNWRPEYSIRDGIQEIVDYELSRK